MTVFTSGSFSFFCGHHELYQGFLAGFLLVLGRAAGFFELLLQGINTSFVLPKNSFVPLLNLAKVEGSAGLDGVFDEYLPLDVGVRVNPWLYGSSETLARARVLEDDFLKGFSFERLQPSSAMAVPAVMMEIRLTNAIRLCRLTVPLLTR